MVVSEVIKIIEGFAPPALAENFDNVGLMVGDKSMRVRGILLTLDVVEESVDEAVERGLNLIITHHPLIFSPLKSLTGKNYIERVLIRAIKQGVAIYSAHTNLDSVQQGVSFRLGEKLGLQKMQVLRPVKNNLLKLVVYSPFNYSNGIRKALADSGAGFIGQYDSCSFSAMGEGRFRATAGLRPFVGSVGELHTEKEERIETVVQRHKLAETLVQLRRVHPYEEMAYDVMPLENMDPSVGLGVIGEFSEEMDVYDFLGGVKKILQIPMIKYSAPVKNRIRRVALCGGAGASFINDAINSGADIYVTGDLKYHDYFVPDGRITIADIGHFESEQFTLDIFNDVLIKKITNFTVCKTALNCNPINYL
ncbi:MAG: Nif3-like dinuclear metal center hexameric protein [Rikenellaceae bacterium]